MTIIKVEQLKKEYTAYERGEGFFEAVKSLFKRRKKVFRALKGIDFSVKKGDIVGFLGPNGAGKSTALKILSGILYPDSGNVNIMGFTPWKDRKKYVSHIGAVFGQKSQLFWDLPPLDAFYFQKAIYKINEDAFQEQLKKFIKMLHIEDIIKRPTRQLSLGERMRCEFVMAMLHQPKIIFLDEPTIGLDIIAKGTIRNFIREINKEQRVTVIITSHDLEDIENLCNKVIIINKGDIVFDDKIKKLKISRKKYITISFYEKINFKKLKKLKGVRIKKIISDYIVRLEVNTYKEYLDEIIKRIRMGKRIKDLDIREPPIVDVIKRIYKK